MSALLLLWGVGALFTSEAQARRAGITETGCTTCHGSNPAELEVTFDPPAPLPGEIMAVDVTVRGGNLRVAGVAIHLPDGGQFSIPAGEPLSIAGSWVIHTQPKPATDGEVRFHVDWVAPAEAGSGPFTIAALAANDDKRQSGDATAVAFGQVAFGCEAVTLYRDTDGDGVGVTSQFLTDCVGLPGFAPLDGDCDDGDAAVFPGAPELCNQLDDDCDGAIDEDVVDQTYFLDEDGDGYGYAEAAVVACIPPEGYVTNSLDCHWLDASINPEAVEICDFVDNDCDGLIDEGVDVYCGIGECRRKSQLCNVLCTEGEPNAETCNGLDDDCDGLIDEEFCAAGEVCEAGECVAFADATPIEAEAPNTSLEPGPSAEPSAPAANDSVNSEGTPPSGDPGGGALTGEDAAENAGADGDGAGTRDAESSPLGSAENATDNGAHDDDAHDDDAGGDAPPAARDEASASRGGCALTHASLAAERREHAWLCLALLTLCVRRAGRSRRLNP